jgi:glucose/arabinose dehydrogenase
MTWRLQTARHARSAASLVWLALLLAACGPSSVTTTSPSPSTSAAVEPSAPATPPNPTQAPSSAPGSIDPGSIALTREVVAADLSDPVDIAVSPAGDGRIYVVEQIGRIRLVEGGETVTQPFLDLRSRISSGGERGLLGMTFHPDFPRDPRIFVNYTDLQGDTVVSEFGLVDGDEARADPDTERILLQIDQPFANHNGGAVVFGPDGMLYISTGDGGSGGDPNGNGQNLDTLLGKILRIGVDGAPTDDLAYRVPDDNPFLDDSAARPEIWVTGLRNPWRIRFDGDTGDLWIGDVGQGEWEEVDLAPAGVGGLNFGWNVMEGMHCFEPRQGCDQTGLTLPVAEYGHGLGCAVIGGVVIRDADQPLFDGRYLFSDSCSGNVWLLDAQAARDGPTDAALIESLGGGISSIALDTDGSVLATDLGAGELIRISASPG